MNWKQITSQPIADATRKKIVRAVVKDLTAAMGNVDEIETRLEEVKAASIDSIKRYGAEETASWASAVIHVLVDLAFQRWSIKFEKGHLFVLRPEEEGGREGLRVRLLSRRNRQLREASVQQFISSMEKWRPYQGTRVSILSLMCDGRVLARNLQESETPADVIKPYLQVVSPDERCEQTGFRLLDIWRYFRHTWSNPYESIPGRSLLLLIRDAGLPFHPVIGIAALSSAAVRLGARDTYIGWDTEHVLARLSSTPSQRDVEWVKKTVDSGLSGIYVLDLIQQKILTNRDLQAPSDEIIERLRGFGKVQKETHHRLMSGGAYKSQKESVSSTDTDWATQAETPLFRSKRALELANLLEMKRDLAPMYQADGGLETLVELVQTGKGRDLLSKVVRVARSMTVGTEISDLTVCGAVAPYNHLAAGKLVAMLATSPDAVAAYKTRYREAESIIASSMAGRSVKRNANLVFIGTTSLYGKRPNQYDRVAYPTSELGGNKGEVVRYSFIPDKSGDAGNSATKGVGTFHFSPETMKALEHFAISQKNGWRVNNVFGEGTSPKMRAIREGVGKLGFIEDEILTHGMGKCLYGVRLARNVSEYLLGYDAEPEFCFAGDATNHSARVISKHWFERWGFARAQRPEILERVKAENLIHPIRHNARIPSMSEDTDPQQSLHWD